AAPSPLRVVCDRVRDDRTSQGMYAGLGAAQLLNRCSRKVDSLAGPLKVYNAARSSWPWSLPAVSTAVLSAVVASACEVGAGSHRTTHTIPAPMRPARPVGKQTIAMPESYCETIT